MILTPFFVSGQQQCARIPDWMKKNPGKIGRVVGGGDAFKPIPWQVGFKV